jgi:protein TonB
VTTVPRRPSIGDRLGSTLFFAILAHGVLILGVTFSSGPFVPAPELPALKVALLVDSAEQQPLPDDAEYLAQRNQRAMGAGADGLRPTTTLSAQQPVSQAGDPSGADLVDGTPREPSPSAERIMTRGASEQRVAALPQSTENPADAPRRRAALIARLVPQTLATELDDVAQLPNDRDERTLIATPATQASVLAEYLDGWRRRVERIGTANFPAEFLGKDGVGRPTLEVVLASDGRLEDIIVRRSSGNKALDQAALKILRLAAPFEPLPQNLRAQYDTLRFAYEWEFDDGRSAAL